MSTDVFYIPCFVGAFILAIMGDYGFAVFGLIMGLLWIEKDDRHE